MLSWLLRHLICTSYGTLEAWDSEVLLASGVREFCCGSVLPSWLLAVYRLLLEGLLRTCVLCAAV